MTSGQNVQSTDCLSLILRSYTSEMLRQLRVIGAIKVATLVSLAFAAPPLGSWSGVIRDVDGAPAAGAVIVLQPTHVTNAASVITTTSAECQFQFSELSAGHYAFAV